MKRPHVLNVHIASALTGIGAARARADSKSVWGEALAHLLQIAVDEMDPTIGSLMHKCRIRHLIILPVPLGGQRAMSYRALSVLLDAICHMLSNTSLQIAQINLQFAQSRNRVTK